MTAKNNDQERLTPEEKRLMRETVIPDRLHDVKRVLEEQVGLNHSFDVIMREMVFGGQRTGILYVNGFAKDVVLKDVLERMSYADPDAGQRPLQYFVDYIVPHLQIEEVSTITEAVRQVLAGGTAVFVEGESRAIVIDAKSYPVRSTEEPTLEKVVRGSKDGFVETLLTNVTLVRRRLRDPRLKFEIMRVGRRSHMDVCIGYINDIADPKLVEAVRDKIKSVDVDGLPMAEKQLEELIIDKGWDPYPHVRFSERPDVISAHLLEGHAAVFVDTSPSVMILPSTFFHLVQHAEEYRQTPAVGTYLRWVRFLGIFASLFLVPFWYLLVLHPELKPAGMQWIGPQKTSHLPLLLQFFLAEIGIDLLRTAAIHTPSPLVTSMGLMAGILVGQIAVQAGVFVNEVILYVAVAAIGMFATPSYELSLANRLVRLGLLVVTALFDVTGFVGGATLWFVLLTVKRSFNSPYMWPFIPFEPKAMLAVLIRRPFRTMRTRVSLTRPQDSSRR